MDIEVQNIDLKHSKISFEVQKSIFEDCFKTKMALWNIPGWFLPDLYKFHITSKEN